MASQLYKVLNNIENGRQRCVNTLQDLGYEIQNEASLAEVGDYLALLPDNSTSNEIVPSNTCKDPSIDPDVWREPSDWPDIKRILKEEDGEGYWAPIAIALLDNEEDTTIFTTRALTVNDYNVFKYHHGTGAYAHCVHKIKTSDGKEYEFDGTEFIHTWDKNKDINQKYRYIIFYEDFSDTTASKAWFCPQRLNMIACACTGFLGNTTYSVDSLTGSTMGSYKIQAVYLLTAENSLTISAMKKSGNPASIVPSTKTLRKAIIEQPAVNSSNWGFTNGGNLYNEVNYVENYHKNSYNKLANNGGKNLVYYKGYVEGVCSGATSQTRYKLKYAYFTDGDQYVQLPANYLSEFAGVVNDIFSQFPNIETIMGSHEGAFWNKKIISLPKITSWSGYELFKRIQVDTLHLPKLKRTGDSGRSLVTDSVVTRILLDSLEEITYPIGGSIHNLKELYLPQLKSITCNGAIINTSYSMLEELELPSLEHLTGTGLNINTLRRLTLKNNFKFNLDLSSCYRLSRSTVLDILNKCATLEDGESYTITLASSIKDGLSPEEIAIATNKGWEVK